jgi:hypothetical protein
MKSKKYKILGITFSKYNFFLSIFLFVGAILLCFQFWKQNELMKNYQVTKAVVKRVGCPPGVRMRPERFEYYFIYNQKEYHGSSSLSDYDVEVGDTVEIKFSVENPKISDAIYERLKIKSE